MQLWPYSDLTPCSPWPFTLCQYCYPLCILCISSPCCTCTYPQSWSLHLCSLSHSCSSKFMHLYPRSHDICGLLLIMLCYLFLGIEPSCIHASFHSLSWPVSSAPLIMQKGVVTYFSEPFCPIGLSCDLGSHSPWSPLSLQVIALQLSYLIWSCSTPG